MLIGRMQGALRYALVVMMLGVFTLALPPAPALACSPPPGYPRYKTADRARAAEVVLEATVTAVTPTPGDVDTQGHTATVDVHQYFKNDGPRSVTVSGFGSGSLCRTEVHVGQRLIFYATKKTDSALDAHYLEPHDAVEAARPETRAEIVAALAARYMYLPLVVK